MAEFDLAAEIANDPLGRGYAGMTAQQIIDDLDTPYRLTPKDRMDSSEILNRVNVPEYLALSPSDRELFWNLMSIGSLNPFGVEATLMIDMFGAGSTTITDLQAMRYDTMTRWEELGTDRAPTVPEVEASR